MYLYFDKQGNLKEQINDEGIRQGNQNINKLYIFWEDAENRNTLGVWYRFVSSASDGFSIPKNVQTPIKMSNTTVTEAIPYDPKRDLKYFKYGQPYKFYVVDFENDGDVLNYGDVSWLASIWFVVDKNDNPEDNQITITDGEVISYDDSAIDVIGMGAVCFFVAGVVQTIVGDENISLAQWNYLIGLYTTWEQHQHDLDDKITELDTKVTELDGTVDLVIPRIEALESAIVTKIDEVKLNGVTQAKSLVDNKVIVSLDLSAYATNLNLKTYAKSLEVSINQADYVATFNLKDADGNIISTQTLDFPIESMVVSGSYDNQTKSIILTLQNGNTTSIPVGDLVDGLVPSDYLTNNYYNKTTVDSLLDDKANESDNAFSWYSGNNYFFAKGNIFNNYHNVEIDDFSKLLESSSNKSLKTLLGEKANAIDNPFTKNAGQNAFTTYSDLYTTGDMSVGGTLETYSIYDNGSATIEGDLDVIGDINASNNISVDFDNLYDTSDNTTLSYQLGLKANITDINSLASNKIDVVKVDGTALTKTTLNNEVSVDIDLTSYATNNNLKTYAKSLEVSMNTTTYVATFLLKDGDGNTLSTQTLDFPLESVVVNGTYDSTNQKIVLTLQNGNTIDIPVSSLISGLVSNDYLTTNYYNKTTTNNLLNDKANTSDLNALTTRVGTLETNSPFTYNSSSQKYVASKTIDMNGQNIENVSDFYVDFLYALDHDSITLGNHLNADGNDIYGVNSIETSTIGGSGSWLEFTSSNLQLAQDEEDFTSRIWCGDNCVFEVDGGNVILGSDGTSLTFETLSNSVDFDDLMTTLNSKANANEVLYTADASITSTANKIVKRDSAGNIEGNYLKSTWLYTSGATDYASWTDVFVNNGGWLYKRAKATFKSDLGIPSGTLTTKENLTPTLLKTAQSDGYGNLDFSFTNVDLTTKQGLGVLTFGNCQILINLYGLTKGTTYYQPATFRVSGSSTSNGVRQGLLAYTYNTNNSLSCVFLEWNGTSWTNAQSGVTYTAYLFLVNLK